MIDNKCLDRALLDLAFTDLHDGTRYLRAAVHYWDEHPGCFFMKELYPCVGSLYGKSAESVERAIRYAISIAFMRADWSDVRRIFGNSLSCYRAAPMASECIVRLAVFAHAD